MGTELPAPAERVVDARRARRRPRRAADDPLAAHVVRRWREDGRPGLAALVHLPPAPSGAPPLEDDPHPPLDPAVAHVAGWAARLGLRGLTLGVVPAPDRTPTLVLDVAADPEAASAGPVLVHAHLDPGGGAGALAALAAVAALQDAGCPHPRCVIVLETAAPRAGGHLAPLLDALRSRLAPPAVALCLDAAPPDGDRLWLTTSLRGAIALTLAVDVLAAPRPAGGAAGVVPSPVRVARRLLDRVECADTGRVLVDALHVDLPGDARAQAAATAALLGDRVWRDLAPLPGVRPAAGDLPELVLDGTWRPALSVVGVDALPTAEGRPDVDAPARVALALAVHLPPTCDATHAARALVDRLQRDPPHGVQVRCPVHAIIGGWRAPPPPAWLGAALGRASRAAFGAREATGGGGEAIAAARLLADAFPGTPLVVTGVPRRDARGAEGLAVALAHLISGAGS